MARIRTIKPEYWSSPSHRSADPWVRLFFVSLWNWADDSGRGTANPRELAAFAFPDDEDPTVPTVDDVPRLLLEVHKRYDVIFYKVDGRRYYEIPSWEKHQRNERKAASRHPGPNDGAPYDPGPGDGASFTESRNFRDSAAEGSLGGRGGGSGGSRKPPRQGSPVNEAAEPLMDHEETQEPSSDQRKWQSPTDSHGTSVHDDGGSAAGTGEPGTGEPGTYCDPTGFELVLVDPSSEPVRTANQRAKTLSDAYSKLVPLSSFHAVRGVVRKAIDCDYSDEEIEAGLTKLADEKRPLTMTSLRVAIEGLPKSTSDTDDKVAGALLFMRPEDHNQYRGNAS